MIRQENTCANLQSINFADIIMRSYQVVIKLLHDKYTPVYSNSGSIDMW